MFNKDVIGVLSQINGVTNSIILKYPVTVAVSETQDTFIHFDVSKVDSTEFPEIALKDNLNEFLSVFKLFGDERNVTIEGKNIEISDGSSTASYIMDVAGLMDSYNKTPEQFEKTESVPSVATFDLLAKDIKSVKSASGVFKDLSEIIFTSQDGDIKVSLGATNKFNAKSNTFSIKKSAKTSKEFEIKIPVENFKSIPETDYIIDVKYNATRNSYRLLLTSKTLDGFKLLMSVKI